MTDCACCCVVPVGPHDAVAEGQARASSAAVVAEPRLAPCIRPTRNEGRRDGSPLEGGKIIPARGLGPNLNAFAERFVLSIKSECIDRIVPLGERHLCWAVREYVAHYLGERPHQGLGGAFIEPKIPTAANSDGEVVCDRRLGGLLESYRRAA